MIGDRKVFETINEVMTSKKWSVPAPRPLTSQQRNVFASRTSDSGHVPLDETGRR
jgi:hypothetical protein